MGCGIAQEDRRGRAVAARGDRLAADRLGRPPLHVGAVDYDAWLARVLELAGRGWCTAIGLHDCYAPSWIERYPALLEQLGGLGELWTLDQVAAEVTLAAAT